MSNIAIDESRAQPEKTVFVKTVLEHTKYLGQFKDPKASRRLGEHDESVSLVVGVIYVPEISVLKYRYRVAVGASFHLPRALETALGRWADVALAIVEEDQSEAVHKAVKMDAEMLDRIAQLLAAVEGFRPAKNGDGGE